MTRALPESGAQELIHLLGGGQRFDPDRGELLPHGRDGFGVVDRGQWHSILLFGYTPTIERRLGWVGCQLREGDPAPCGAGPFRMVYDFLACALARTTA